MQKKHFVAILVFVSTLLVGAAVHFFPNARPPETVLLTHPQPTAAKERTEVILFFMYHCTFCHKFDHEITSWAQKNADTVSFKRIAIPSPNELEDKLFLVLHSMNLVETLHTPLMQAIHVTKQPILNSEESLLKWVDQQPIDHALFLQLWNDPSMPQQVQELNLMAQRYQADRTPVLVLNGQVQTSPASILANAPTNSTNVISERLTSILHDIRSSATLAHP